MRSDFQPQEKKDEDITTCLSPRSGEPGQLCNSLDSYRFTHILLLHLESTINDIKIDKQQKQKPCKHTSIQKHSKGRGDRTVVSGTLPQWERPGHLGLRVRLSWAGWLSLGPAEHTAQQSQPYHRLCPNQGRELVEHQAYGTLKPTLAVLHCHFPSK